MSHYNLHGQLRFAVRKKGPRREGSGTTFSPRGEKVDVSASKLSRKFKIPDDWEIATSEEAGTMTAIIGLPQRPVDSIESQGSLEDYEKSWH